jgi:predicted alpha/beta hydrolase family esterase
MSKILFLHGLESLPGGSKVKYLEKKGFEVLNPHLPKYSWNESVESAKKMLVDEEPDVVVGSSRGGAVAMEIMPSMASLILIAPAWKRFGIPPIVPASTMILHCVNDQVVPYDDSMILKNNCGATLVACGANHRMADGEALEGLEDAIKWILKKR